MKKKCSICGGIFIVAAIIITLIIINSQGIDRDNLSEMEKYALFRAEFTCKSSDYGTGNMWKATDELQELTYEYGYDFEEMEPLQLKYEENNEFWLISMNYMKELCPEVVDQMLT